MSAIDILNELPRLTEAERQAIHQKLLELQGLKASESKEETFNGLLLSETALAKDWNTPEEDAAWANL